MKTGSFLIDAERREERFRIKELLHTGGSHQIALAEDTHLDDKLVCVKTILYDTDRLDNGAYIKARREALREEMTFLTLRTPILPEPIDWLEIGSGPVESAREPVLVYEYQHGQTLHELVTRSHARGLAPLRALRIFRRLAIFLGEIHEGGYVFRDLDPRHVIIGFDDVVHVVGCGNAVPMKKRLNAAKVGTNEAYTAPEIRNELSGSMLSRASDIYSLGALFSFMLTGEEPRASVESPLSYEAYTRLKEIEPPGLALLLARCIQPLPKKRFTGVRKLLPYCEPDALPTRESEGFGMVMLPAPWRGAEPPETPRALKSKLSAGPLISVGSEGEESMEEGEVTHGSSRRRLVFTVAMVAVVLAILIVLTLLQP
ncbi:MAG: serine/threonine protein kinase [Bradymonadaceae bacterium]